ncbi:MAG: biosynthetic arginine decarboxylase [Fuerstiella sp.]|nr:biosynthetic arginine decarboxylase [Fuerstiella sp.]
MTESGSAAWSAADAAELYEVARWGDGYFSVETNGNLLVHPDRNPDRSIDLKKLIDRLQLRGIDVPVLLRFNGIIRDRLKALNDAFASATSEYGYTGTYSCVYPIKVNQQREVVEKVIECGREFGFGLEAGSKPELLAVVAMTEAQTPIICNGFKDAEFIEMALLAQKVGRHVIPVVEKYTELELILRCAQRIGMRPVLGVRVKLASRGAGRWQSSGGYRSKFGLRVNEILNALEHLKSCGMEDCLQLLHFHLGSQITNIRQLKAALNEGSRVYTDLVNRGAGLRYLDVGGGLGVDYDGSQTNSESSMNYTLAEYARDVVYHIQTVCDDATVPHPHIISESGRAVSAFHSVLVFSVLGVSQQGREEPQGDLVPPADAPQPVHDLYESYTELTQRNVLESYHDAQNAIELAMTLFATGHLPLEQRCLAESLYFSICHRIWTLTGSMEYVPEELEALDRLLSDNYFCNFSLFRSIPDSWAIKQLFPVMPIHRLGEQPKRHAVLSDMTCDSDGKIDQFISRRDAKRTLLLHEFDGTPYYIGTFLVGAYQEILGDLHNLFGDTNAVHLDISGTGEVTLDTILKGQTISEVLEHVQINGRDLIHRLQLVVDTAVRTGRIDDAQAAEFVRCYQHALSGYTYLDEPELDRLSDAEPIDDTP